MSLGDQDISHISGNVSNEVKRICGNPSRFFLSSRHSTASGPIFGETIFERMVVTEISVRKTVEESQKSECRLVCELTVEDDMVNRTGNVHGGCSAFLIDMCSSMALVAFSLTNEGKGYSSVSQSLNVIYHSPAAVGDRLRIVNTTLTLGSRAHSARTEIWNLTHHRLVSSGVHVKMQPSELKANL